VELLLIGRERGDVKDAVFLRGLSGNWERRLRNDFRRRLVGNYRLKFRRDLRHKLGHDYWRDLRRGKHRFNSRRDFRFNFRRGYRRDDGGLLGGCGLGCNGAKRFLNRGRSGFGYN